MFYKQITRAESLKIRNDIFIKDVVPILAKKGFIKSPFYTSCFGRTSNNGIYIYDMCRLRQCNLLEFVTTKISSRDRYIKIYVNTFALHPKIQEKYSLSEIDVTKYNIYPNNGREMWIDVDFIVGPPLFSIDFWYNCLKLKNSYTTRGRIKQIERLKKMTIAKVDKIETYFDKLYAKYHYDDICHS